MAITHAPSRKKLLTCHPKLRLLVNTVAERIDLLVICGYRNEADQNLAFLSKASKLKWPKSKHNKKPSMAVDCAPLDAEGKLDWKDIEAFKNMIVVFKEEAKKLGIEIICGGDWKTFKDYVHFEMLQDET